MRFIPRNILDWNPPKIFYGWWIVAACFLIAALSGGFVFLGFTALIEPIADEFGWSYAQISLAASLIGVELGLIAPISGLLVDRWGPRRLAVSGVLLIGFGLMFLSRISSLVTFYTGYALIAVGISGCSPTVLMTTIANWFRKKLGIALGIVSSGFAIGGLLVPMIVKLISVFDWRMALIIMGLTTLVIGLPFSLLFRHKPEQYGYLPDGEKSTIKTTDEVPLHPESNEVAFGTKQALKSRTFWHIGLAMMFQAGLISAVVAHIMPFLSSIGIERSTASLAAMSTPLISIFGRLGSGWLSDRYNKKRAAIGCFVIMAFGLLCANLVFISFLWLIVPFLILFGIGWGGYSIIRAALIREYFGRSNFGSIFGFYAGITALGSFSGPLFAGWVFDSWASYQIAWLVFAILIFVGMLIIATTPPVSSRSRNPDFPYQTGDIGRY
ncbi:MFS transporter [Chloroflexota bacterium]